MSDYRRITEEEIRLNLSQRKVSPEIIDRVVRLNPNAVEGDRLRGIHYKGFDDPQFWFGCIRKRAFLRQFGRDAFNALDPRAILKRGRRVYVRAAYAPLCGA